MIDEVHRSSGLDRDKAVALVQSLLRVGREEKFKLAAYPLVPLSGGRVAFAPSLVLLAMWPNVREQALARARDAAVGQTRSRRYAQRIVRALSACGHRVAIDVPVPDPAGRHLTDLDVVATDPEGRSVLVVQVKAYVTPTNMIDLQRAERGVKHAITQCETADAHRDAVRLALEKRFSSRLHEGWELRQVIAIEALAGLASSAAYPVVTAEWFEAEACSATISLAAAWEAARRLSDGAEFIASIHPAFALYEGLPPEVGPVAVFGDEA